jgi:hypothetical protein
MSSLRQIAQEVIRLESGGSPSNDSELSEGYVIFFARQAANKVVRAKEFERLAEDDRSGLNLIMASFEVTVQGTIPNKYIDLPAAPMNFAFNKGLAIAPAEDPTNFYIPRHTPGVSRNLPCADLDPGQVSYWMKGLRVYFDNEEPDLAKVLVDIAVVAPDTLSIDATLPIYPEQEYDVIMLTRQMLLNQPIQDKILDNNKDVGVRIK